MHNPNPAKPAPVLYWMAIVGVAGSALLSIWSLSTGGIVRWPQWALLASIILGLTERPLRGRIVLQKYFSWASLVLGIASLIGTLMYLGTRAAS